MTCIQYLDKKTNSGTRVYRFSKTGFKNSFFYNFVKFENRFKGINEGNAHLPETPFERYCFI